MSALEVALKQRRTVARDTITALFEKPAGFTFKSGQSVDLTLIDPPKTDAKGNKRAFSIVSAPHEPHLQFATRVRDSAFKQTLRDMPLGTRVQIEGPFGSMTLHGKHARPAVILAGGIGITPFMSMVRHTAHENLPHNIVLLFSNRKPEDAPFLDELQQLERFRRATFRFVPTMTGPADPAWSDRVGIINAELIKGFVPPTTQPVFYTAGPPAMVAAMRQLLKDLNVEDDDIRSEDFSGY